MTRTLTLGLVFLAVLLACDQANAPDVTGGGALDVRITASGHVTALDSGRVHIDGPTDRIIKATPGTTVTVTDLQPGMYTVSLEGFLGDQVTHFGRAAGIEVVAGQNTAATIPFDPFGPPEIDNFSFTGNPNELVLTFAAVPNAASYSVDWDTDPGFSAPTTLPVNETSASIDLGGEADVYYVRTRAVDPYGGSSQASQTLPLTLIGFEHYPGGTPSCPACTITSEFTSLNIDFLWNHTGGACPQFASLADGHSSGYGDAGNPDNHFVTGATSGGGTGGGCLGSLALMLSGEPHFMAFDWGTSNDVGVFPVFFYDANGEIPASNITRVPLRTYISNGGFEFKWDQVTVFSETGIHQILVNMNGIVQQLDNIRIVP